MEPVTDAESVADRLRRHFDSGVTRPYRWRATQLRALRRLILDNQGAIEDALHTDLGKPTAEVVITDTGPVIGEIDYALRRLRLWMRPRRVRPPLVLIPSLARVIREPRGVVLIISPWNYPVNLLLSPLVGALAAGNTVILKPSEVAAATGSLLARLIPQFLDSEAVAVVEGGAEVAAELLEQRLDHIFFTGSEPVARIVAAAAARSLTPVTLEMGGKSPVYVDGTVDLATTARRIMWGKLINSGQTCVAPDYVLATPQVAGELVPHLQRAVQQMYGPDAALSPDYGSIVTVGHAKRLARLLEGQPISFGGTVDVGARRIAPVVIDGADPASPLMQEEIFGPILPIVHVASGREALDFIRARPKPLSLYLFSRDPRVRRAFAHETSSGALGIGFPTAHLGVPGLPFGGVGASGIGAYHGERSFMTFTHEKAVLDKPLHPDTASMAYPPYGRPATSILMRLMQGPRGPGSLRP